MDDREKNKRLQPGDPGYKGGYHTTTVYDSITHTTLTVHEYCDPDGRVLYAYTDKPFHLF